MKGNNFNWELHRTFEVPANYEYTVVDGRPNVEIPGWFNVRSSSIRENLLSSRFPLDVRRRLNPKWLSCNSYHRERTVSWFSYPQLSLLGFLNIKVTPMIKLFSHDDKDYEYIVTDGNFIVEIPG